MTDRSAQAMRNAGDLIIIRASLLALLRGRYASCEITIAFVALGAGDTTRALDALERAARAREAVGLMAPFGLPAYDALRASARFTAVIRAFGGRPQRIHDADRGSPVTGVAGS